MPVEGIPFNSPTVGFWTSQAAIERYLGEITAGTLSNLNGTNAGADAAGFADAIDAAETWLNYELARFGYPTGATSPAFPAASSAYGVLCRSATVLAAAWLYTKRGVYDEGARKLAGAFAKTQEEAEAAVRRVVRDGIRDVPRAGISNRPAVVLSPAARPFGCGTAANLIRTVP